MRKLQRWDSDFTSEETNGFAEEVASILLSRILDEEARRSLSALVAGGDYLALSDYSLDYTRVSVGDAICIRQLLALFQKRRDLGDDVAREITALKTFREAERLCGESNAIFRAWNRGGFQFPPDVEAVLFAAQRKISHVLGDVPELSSLRIRFGPGATTTVLKRDASARSKLAAPFACSGDLAGTVSECLEEMPAWLFPNLLTEEGDSSDSSKITVEIHSGRLVFVPKDRKTFRAIGPEPMLNGMFQLGIGTYMAERLRRFGVDIRDQTKNQKLARSGSIDGGLATLDLSSASDCVSIGLVEHLLPVDWYVFLSRFRTGIVEYADSPIKLEKFSTMGNGFTFPLETLIFWALAQSVCETRQESDSVSVFGDDIIVPTHRYEKLVKVLNAAGFLVNLKKSFASGPFRESCGADYLSGINIRPYYLRDRLTGENAFSMYNYFARQYDDEICSAIQNLFDPAMILWGPDGYGDGHLVTRDPVLQSHRFQGYLNQESRGYGGYTFETYTWKSRRDFLLRSGDYALPSYSIYVTDQDDEMDLALSPYLAITALGRSVVDIRRGFPSESIVSYVYRKGRLGVPTPGKQGYKRIKIYTFG